MVPRQSGHSHARWSDGPRRALRSVPVGSTEPDPLSLLVLLVLATIGLALWSPAAADAAQKLGEGCSVFKKCGKGLSCHPFIQKCYHKPRREGEPCMAGFGCDKRRGLTCEAGSQRCRARGKIGERCHATRPCDRGLSCKAFLQRCGLPDNGREKDRVTRAYRAQSRKYDRTHKSMAADMKAAGEQPGRDHDARRRRLMRDTLEKHRGEGFTTVTLLGAVSGSFIAGYGHGRGYAMSQKGRDYACRAVVGHSFTAGAAVGVSGVEELGLWKGSIGDLAGETNGVQGTFSLLVLTFGGGIHWSVGAKDPTGITTVSGGGLGLDFGTEYVHGWTILGDSKNCNALKW